MGRQYLRNASHVVNVIAQRHEQVEEELRAAGHHLHLHCAAALEGAAAADDECEVVGSQLRVGIGCVGVGVASGCQDCAALDAGFCCMLVSIVIHGSCFQIAMEVLIWFEGRILTQTLLPQRNTLQLIQAVLLRRAIYDRILQQLAINAVMVYCALHASRSSLTCLQLP